MIEVTISGRGQLKGAKTDIIESLVIKAKCLVRVLHKLMNRQRGVVRLHYGIRHLRWRNDTESAHYPVGVFLPDFCYYQSSQSGAGASAKRVQHLKALNAVATFGFFPQNVQHWIDNFCTFGVMTFCPVVASPTLTCKIYLRLKHWL